MSKLARLIAKEEGFGIPGAIPTTHNNPGDLEHSPHSFHTTDAPNAIGQIDNLVDGWADLELQLQEDAARGWDMQKLIYTYAPPSQNNSAEYLAYVCSGLGCSPNTLVSDALQIT